MKQFLALCDSLERGSEGVEPMNAIIDYFKKAPMEDSCWGLWLLLGNQLGLGISSYRIRQWGTALHRAPDWLEAICFSESADIAEACSLINCTNKSSSGIALHHLIEEHLIPLKNWNEEAQFQLVRTLWSQLTPQEGCLVNKLLVGRKCASLMQQTLFSALSDWLSVENIEVAHRLSHPWTPSATFMDHLINRKANALIDKTKPYPFLTPTILEDPSTLINDSRSLMVEWLPDGIRAQLIKRENLVKLWSLENESLNELFPNLIKEAEQLPDGIVLDGWLIYYENDQPKKFPLLQSIAKRQNFKSNNLAKSSFQYVANDCLESENQDIRDVPTIKRRNILNRLFAQFHSLKLISTSTSLDITNLETLRTYWLNSRNQNATGLYLKPKQAPYSAKIQAQTYLYLKTVPYVRKVVLLYSKLQDSLNPSSSFTELTFAARKGNHWVSVAKIDYQNAFSNNSEIINWINQNTLSKKGPIRTLPATQVFEIAFDNIRPNYFYKCGFVLESPKINRWCINSNAHEVDTLSSFQQILES